MTETEELLQKESNNYNKLPFNIIRWPHYIDESFIVREREGTIESYHPYKANIYRAVTTVTPCAALQWKLLEFDVEWEETGCGFDYLIVNYGEATTGRMCGSSNEIYKDWTFHFEHKFELVFKTDCSNNYYGFKIAWQCVDGRTIK